MISKYIYKICAICAILSIAPTYLWAQQSGTAAGMNCSQTLRLVRLMYEQGKFREIPALLGGCLDSFNQNEKTEAIKLITLSHIYGGEPEAADASILQLLRKNPYFTINREIDPAEFVALYNTYRTHPVYRIGIKYSPLFAMPRIQFGDVGNQGDPKYIQSFSLYGFGLTYEYLHFPRFIINAELYFEKKIFTNRVDSRAANNSLNLQAQHTIDVISLPITMQYVFLQRAPNSVYTPYLSAGIGINYVIQDEVTIEGIRKNAQALQERTLRLNHNVSPFGADVIAGAGLKIKVGKGKLIIDARYKFALSNINSSADSYNENADILWDYHYVDGVFRVDALSFSLGYMWDFFNPKKKQYKSGKISFK